MNEDLSQEMASDAGELLSDFGRSVTFRSVSALGEAPSTTLSTEGLLGDPMLSERLEEGGVVDVMSVELKVLRSTALPSSWRPFEEVRSWIGRNVTITGFNGTLRIKEATCKEGSPWAVFRIDNE